MSNPNGLLSQKFCHYLNQGCTLNNILMRAAHWMAYLDLSKLNLVKLMSWKCLNPNCNGNRHDKVALRTTCNNIVKSRLLKQGQLVCRIRLLWQKPKLGCIKPSTGPHLDIADLTVWAMAKWSGPRWPKSPPLMTSLTKIWNPNPKYFFSLQTRRLAKSFELLNSSLMLSVPELCLRKAMCDPTVFTELLELTRQQRF